jgi:hypothetical protein
MNALFWTSYAILCLLVLTLLVCVFGLYQHFGRIYLMTDEGREAQGPGIGTEMQIPKLTNVSSGVAAPVLTEKAPSVLIFMSQSCPLCQKIRSSLMALKDRRAPVDAVILSGASSTEAVIWADKLPVPVFLDPSGRTAAKLGIDAIPFCIALDRDGRVVSKGIVNDLHGLEIAQADARSLPIYEQV